MLQTLMLVGDYSASLIGAASERALAPPYSHTHSTTFHTHATHRQEAKTMVFLWHVRTHGHHVVQSHPVFR
jgi:hypothetical protein